MNRSIAAARTVHFTLPRTSVRRMLIGAFRVATVALLITAIDVLASIVYWQMHGVSPAGVLQSVAAWALGPRPPATAAVSAVGLAVFYLIYLAMAAVFRCTLARRDAGKHLTAIGCAYGVMMYVTVYLVLIPLLVYPQRLHQSPEWLATCVLLHGAVLGPLMAWLLRRPRTPA